MTTRATPVVAILPPAIAVLNNQGPPPPATAPLPPPPPTTAAPTPPPTTAAATGPAPPTTYVDQGCWRDSEDRTLSIKVDNGDRNYTTVDACGAIASKNFLTTFALQDGNRFGKAQCFLAREGTDKYARQGAVPSPCAPLGDGYVNHVYTTTIPAGNRPAMKDLGCWSSTSPSSAILPLRADEKTYFTPEACAAYVRDNFASPPWWQPFSSVGRTYTVRDGMCYVSDKDGLDLTANGNTTVACAATTNGGPEPPGVFHMYRQPGYWWPWWG